MNASRPSLTLLLAALPLAGCRAHPRSPSLDVIGSYFPAWIVCIIVGLILTLLTRQLLIALKLDGYLRFVGLVYLGLTTLFTLAAWLIYFKN